MSPSERIDLSWEAFRKLLVKVKGLDGAIDFLRWALQVLETEARTSAGEGRVAHEARRRLRLVEAEP